jgi:hypothetical protein
MPCRFVTSHFSAKGWARVLGAVFATSDKVNVDDAHVIAPGPRSAVIVATILLHRAIRVFRVAMLANVEAETAHG